MPIREAITQLHHEAFARRGFFEEITRQGIPCLTQRDAANVGEKAAWELARASYLITRLDLLAYKCDARRTRLERSVRQLLDGVPEVEAAYSFAALGNIPEARKAARRAEQRRLSEWRLVNPGEYTSRVEGGSLDLVRDIDPYQGCPSLVLILPAEALSVRPEHLFSIDVDAYLALEDIGGFERRYDVVLRLVEHVRQRLA